MKLLQFYHKTFFNCTTNFVTGSCINEVESPAIMRVQESEKVNELPPDGKQNLEEYHNAVLPF
jgi:hypothetical protein